MNLILPYIIPLLPIFTRGFLLIKFRSQMKEKLSDREKDKETHRIYIMSLAGFSFSALLALVLLDAKFQKDLQLSIFYLFLSFLGYLFALNMQSYKEFWWQDQLATAATELGSLCLVLSIIGILLTNNFNRSFALSLSGLGIIIWLADHLFRIYIVYKFRKKKRK